MENSELVLMLLICGVVFLTVVVAIIKYLVEFYRDIEYAKLKMRTADDWNGYVHWRQELRVLRFCIIPGLTPERVRNIKARFTNREKAAKSDGFTSLVLPSVIGICLCGVCLASGTFAWFTASQNATVPSITSAQYTLEITVNNSSDNEDPVAPDANGVYTILGGQKYSVTLISKGTASTGYAILTVNGKTAYHTVQFPTKAAPENKQITFTLDIKQTADIKQSADITLKIEPQWGSSSKEGFKLENQKAYSCDISGEGDSLLTLVEVSAAEQPASEQADNEADEGYTEYLVQENDTLFSIAVASNTTVDELKALNGMDDSSVIYAGERIKIPVADTAQGE